MEKITRKQITLNMLNLALLMNFIYVFITGLTYGIKSPEAYKVISMLAVLISLRIIFARKNPHWLPELILVAVTLGVYYNFLFGGNGLRAPAFTAGASFLILYAGLLRGTKGALVMLIFHSILAVSIHFLEQRGIYFTDPIIPRTGITVTGQILFFTASTYLLVSTLKQLNQHLVLHKKEAQYRSRTEKKIRKLNEELIRSYEITLRGWSRALELKDKETEGHSHRVVELSRKLGEAYGLPKSLLIQLEYGAMLHDIGKMGTPDAILRKEGPLDDNEKDVIKQHPELAYDLLKEVAYLKEALVVPLHHHERWDGSGYPHQLKGDDIPLLARIFCIADVWDALTSPRPYSPSWTRQEAIDHLIKQKGRHFDPELTDLFLQLV